MNKEQTEVNSKVKELPESFNKWRNDIIEKAKEDCCHSIGGFYLGLNREVDFFETMDLCATLPKSIVRLTRHMCDCKEDCTQNSLSNFEFTPCKFYNTENLYEDDKYYDNILIDKKVIDGKLVDRNVTTDGESLRKDIKKYVIDLCDDEEGSLRKLKCKAYELKNYCGENQDCISNVIYNILPDNFKKCKKREFGYDLENIGLKIGDPKILTHVRITRDLPQTYNSAGTLNKTGFCIVVPVVVTGLYLLSKICKINYSMASIGLFSIIGAAALTFNFAY